MAGSFSSMLPPNGREIISSILRSLSKETPDSVAGSHMIVGEDRSEQALLLKLLHREITKNYYESFRPVFVDGRTVFSLDDLWKHVGESKENDLRTVLLIYDISYVLQRLDDKVQYVLRHRLASAGSPILIASSSMVPRELTDYNAALFEWFKIHYIKPVEVGSFSKALRNERDKARLATLMQYLPKTVSAMTVALQIVRNPGKTESDLAQLRDYVAPTYQVMYGNSSVHAQRILAALASGNPEGMTLSSLRSATGLDSGRLSPYLTIMLEKGIIARQTPSIRGGVYRIADPLYWLWLQKEGVS